MRVLTSELFRFLTPASAPRVWAEITRTGEPLPYLYGLILRTDWQPQSAITAGLPAGPALTGQVLHVRPPWLLTYSLGDHPGTPSVYLTWQLEATPAGTLVRLYVDEPGPAAGSDGADLELTWLPAIGALQARLAGGPGHPPSRPSPGPG